MLDIAAIDYIRSYALLKFMKNIRYSSKARTHKIIRKHGKLYVVKI